jgi:hypothetical protein
MLKRDVFGPIDTRRRAFDRPKLSREEREQLLSQVRFALAIALDAYQDEVERSGGGRLPRKSEIKRRRRFLRSIEKTAERAAKAVEALRFDDQDRLSRLTFDERARIDPAGAMPAAPTHLSLGSSTIAAQVVELRAMARAANRLGTDLGREPPAPPRERFRRALVQYLVWVFARFTETRATHVVGRLGEVTGRLEQFLRALIPPALHDPDVGLDHQIRAAVKEMSG